jgi:hypothetical protein
VLLFLAMGSVAARRVFWPASRPASSSLSHSLLPPQSTSSSNTAGHVAPAQHSTGAPPDPNGAYLLPVPPRFPGRASSVPAHRPRSSREAAAPLQLPPVLDAQLGGQGECVAGAGASRWVLGRWRQRER